MFVSCYDIEEVKAHKEISVCIIEGTNRHYRRDYYMFNYSFKVNGITYKGSSSYGVNRSYVDYFLDRKFFVVFSTRNPENSFLVMTSLDYKRWNLVYPDSLRWAEELLIKGQ